MTTIYKVKKLISEIYILNFFQKCKLIEKVEQIENKSGLKEIEKILIEIRKLQESLLNKALKNSKNKDKVSLLNNLLSKAKISNINLLEKTERDNEDLDVLIDMLWKSQ